MHPNQLINPHPQRKALEPNTQPYKARKEYPARELWAPEENRTLVNCLHQARFLRYKSQCVEFIATGIEGFGSGTVGELNRSDVPMVETHFYKWLYTYEPLGYHHTLGTIKLYLDWLGFVPYKNKVSPEDLRGLRFILYHHWASNHKKAFMSKL